MLGLSVVIMEGRVRVVEYRGSLRGSGDSLLPGSSAPRIAPVLDWDLCSLCSDSLTTLLFFPIGSKTKEGVVQGVASGTRAVLMLYGGEGYGDSGGFCVDCPWRGKALGHDVGGWG